MKNNKIINAVAERVVELCAPAEIYLATYKQNLKQELTAFKLLIVVNDVKKVSDVEEKIYMGSRSSRLNVVATVNSLEAIKRCVINGLGVSVVSETVIEKDKNAGYLAFKLSDINLEREFYMVTNKNTTLSPTTVKFKEFVLNQFQG